MTGVDIGGAIGDGVAKSLALIAAIGALVGWGLYEVFNNKPLNATFTTSLTFSVTNRLAVTHYVIIPATHGDWAAMTSRYPANVTKTVLNFK